MPSVSQFYNKRNRLREQKLAEGFDPELVVVPGCGPMPCCVMFIGERPGKDEPWATPPRPFVGAAGMELDRYLTIAGLRRDEVYITNLVKTYRDEDPEEWEVVRDHDELMDEILGCCPDVIVTLGAFATKSFLGDVTMEMVNGIPLPDQGYWAGTVFPIIHPAAGLHSVDSMSSIVYGFERLRAFLSGQLSAPEDAFPSPLYGELKDRAVQFQSDLLGIDTEGSRAVPWCLTFASSPGISELIHANQPSALKQFNAKIRMFKGHVLLHNSLHDLSVLGTLGVEIPEGRFIDTMVLAYLLCREPQGLKPLAYRRAGMRMKSYDELVEPKNREFALEYVRVLADNEWGPAEPYVLMEVSKGGVLAPKIKRPHTLNQRLNRILSDWEKSGGVLDVRQRWTNMRGDNPRLVEEAEDVFGEMPVADLSDVDREEAIAYANRDSDATLRIAPGLMEEIWAMGLEQVMRIDHDIIPMIDRMQRVGFGINAGHFTDYLTPRMDKECEEIQQKIKTLTGAWINPDSGDQCAALLFDQLNLPWTKLTKSKKRPKCDDKVLEGLRTAHPVVTMVTDYRERSKIRSAFSRVLPRMAGADGRVRCNLRITRVSSGRLAANTPNLLAIPVRSNLGLEVRKGFRASEGHLLGTWDLDQIEMREMAHQSKDPTMCGIFNDGKVDIHRQTASFMFGIRPEDVTTIQRYAAKRVGFGVITGITGLGLMDQMAMAGAVGWDERRCDDAIVEWFKMYPGARIFMEACRTEARRYGFVRDRWGRIRYLPAVHSPIRHVREEAERQSHSFKISASAQGTMKIGMKAVWDDVIKAMWKAGAWIEPLLQVHDELIMEMEEEIFPVVDNMTIDCLTKTPRIQMLVPVKAKGACGRTWGELEK